jgi:hypothetical protein
MEAIMSENPLFKSLIDRWPSSYVARQEISKFTGGIISERYIANLDCQGKGPQGRIRVGRKIAYTVESVIRFLESRAQLVADRKRTLDAE